jgi:hypothetical protein
MNRVRCQPGDLSIRDADMGSLVGRMYRFRPARAAGIVLIFAAILLGALPIGPLNAAGAVTSVEGAGAMCASRQLNVRVTSGLGGAGHVSSVILVSNIGPGACRLTGYPDIRFLNARMNTVALTTATPRGFSGGLPVGAPVPKIDLRKGEVASAVMEGTDIPQGNATTCPTYSSYTITIPGVPGTRRIRQAFGSCAGVSVHPFVLGFNGTFPSGEVVGMAPTCEASAQKDLPLGPFVQIEAWSDSHLAGMVTVAAGSTAKEPYGIILRPGSYRIESAHGSSSRHEFVHAGRIAQLHTFGRCFQPAGIPTTIPARPGRRAG